MTNAPVAQSALHETYTALRANLVNHSGWQMPTSFGSSEVETQAIQNGVGIGECCGTGVLQLAGNDISQLAEHLGAGNIAPGSAVLANINGVKEARWCQLTRHHARLIVHADEITAASQTLQGNGSCAHITDISSGLTTFALVGPRSRDVLPRLTRLDLDPNVHGDRKLVMTGSVGIPLQILRWDRAGVLVYELTVGRDLTEYFWDSVFHNAKDLGLKPVGMNSLTQLGIVGGGAQA